MTDQLQTNNKAFVVGVLKKKEIEFKPTKSTNKLRANGYLTVIVDTPVGKGEVKVKVQQYAEKKDGTANSLYKALQTVSQEYKSVEEVGSVELADTIKIEGELVDETYYSVRKEEFVEKLEIKGVFIKRVDSTEPHCCKVAFEGCISKITPIENELEVEIVGIGYEGVGIPVKGIIQENLVAPFQGRYNIGCTTTLNIAILNQVEVVEIQEEVGFGEGFGEKIEKHTTKRIIFGGGKVEYGRISTEQVKQALAIRETKLDEKKQYAMENSKPDANMNAGFGAMQQTTNFGAMQQGNSGFGGFANPGTFGVPGGFPQ